MINVNELIIDAFIERLREGYLRTYGNQNADFVDIISWAGGMALENIANSDAMYHDIEHTVLVTLVGQEILRGKQLRESGITSEDWLHFIISLLCHDIGYVKGVCRKDRSGEYATGKSGNSVKLPRGSSDASLTPYHVDRAKLFIDERFTGHKIIKAEQIKENIELTRFPVPDKADSKDVKNFPGLLRASDLVGQLSDPDYLRKIRGLFYEFEETGVNAKLGYTSPADLLDSYPRFYWENVFPFIEDAIPFLTLTQSGKQIVSNLYSNVFMVEHKLGQC